MSIRERNGRISLRPLLIVTATLSAWANCHAGAPETESAKIIERLQSAIRYEVEAKNLPAFSMALVDGDRVVWAEGFGFQDAEKKVPATPDTVYRVGSVSKLFTDIAVMQLVEQGKIDLDAPVQIVLPSFAPKNDSGVPITLRQLTAHRSGLVRESPVGHYFDPTEPTLRDTVESLNRTAIVYKPGTRTKYSNAGIAVVGEVVEKIAGVPYSKQIEETILKPLGMSNSSFVLTPEVDKKLATAYMWSLDGRRFVAPKFAIGTAPAGNLYSSVNDLARFLSCVFADGKSGSGKILSPETLQKMMTPPVDSNGKPQGFAIGFHVGTLDGHKTIGHGGAVYGFSTTVEALPQEKLGVAAVAALDGANGVAERLAQFALRLMLAQKEGKPLPEYRRTTSIAAARAAELVGEYEREGFPAKITELAGRVWLANGDFCREVRAAADNGELLVDDPVGFGAKVALDEKRNLVLGERTFTRLADEPPAPAPDRWKGLIGEYGWDHNTLYILENRGRLVALIEWFYAYPVTEINENEFAFPDHGLYHGEKLFFTRDAAGRATKCVAAEVAFLRREVGTKDGETFRIKPVKPIDELRAAAQAAKPPAEQGDFLKADLVELVTLDPTIKLDIRYASTNNFTGDVFYKQPRAFMQRAAAEALVRANQRLKSRGLGLLVHDAYRPWSVTKMFWDATPEEFKHFVADPSKGSRHNRGCAVDLTLYDLTSGQPIQMVGGYDEFSPRSFPLYPGGTTEQRWHRDLLRRTMEAEGFAVYEFEWWHFDFKDWKRHSIGNVSFEEIPAAVTATK